MDYEKVIDHLVDTGVLKVTGESSPDGSPVYEYLIRDSRIGLIDLFEVFAEGRYVTLQEDIENHFELGAGALDGFFLDQCGTAKEADTKLIGDCTADTEPSVTEAWVRWWRDDDYARPPQWSKWHHVTDHRAGPLMCRPTGFQIPAGAEYQDGRPPPADTCVPCIKSLVREIPAVEWDEFCSWAAANPKVDIDLLLSFRPSTPQLRG